MRLDAWDFRVSDVLTVAKTFIQESQHPVTYSPEGLAYVWRVFNDPNSAILLNYQNDEIAGVAIVTRSTDFCAEYMGYLIKFYIMPSGRKTRAARELMQEVVQWFDTNECVTSFGSAAAGIGQDQAYINLLSKFGYKELGRAMVREKQ